MQNSDRRKYDVLVRVRDFGRTYGTLFPESSPAAAAFAAVNSAVSDIDTNDVAETAASIAARATRKREAREALLERLTLLARTAQVLGEADTEFTAHFKLPDAPSDQVLLTTARQCVQRAVPRNAQFAAHGMSLGEMTDLIDRFDEAIQDRGMSRGQLVAARAAIQSALTSGFKAVKQLDVIVANHLASNSVALEVWRRGRRIHYRPGPRKDVTPSEPVVVVASPPPLPAAPTEALP
jgi:hypothetical protein